MRTFAFTLIVLTLASSAMAAPEQKPTTAVCKADLENMVGVRAYIKNGSTGYRATPSSHG